MRNGLAIVMSPGSSYYGALTRVGRLRRVAGDELEIVSARSIRRVSGMRHIADVAKTGTLDDHELGPMAEHPEPIHRLLIRRVVYVDPNGVCKKVVGSRKHMSYDEACPKPADWVEAES